MDKDRIRFLEDKIDRIERILWADEECRLNPILQSVSLSACGKVKVYFKSRFLFFIWEPVVLGRYRSFQNQCCYNVFMDAKGWKQL